MKLFNFLRPTPSKNESLSSIEEIYRTVKNLFEFTVEVSEGNGNVLFIHFFNGIRTLNFGIAADSFNGFSHYGVRFGFGGKPLYTLTLVHLKSLERINLESSLFRKSGLPTPAFLEIIDDLYRRYDEIKFITQPRCYDVKNNIWLIMENFEERNERRMSESFDLLNSQQTKKEIQNHKYFLDVFSDWFSEL